MQVVEIKSTLKVEDILNGVAQLETTDLEDFLQQVGVLLARRKAPNLEQTETLLLKKINNSLSTIKRKEYNHLQQKQKNGTLTKTERTVLLNLVEVVENADVERLKDLIALSRLRGVPLKTLMQQLDIEVSKEQMINELDKNHDIIQ